MVNWHKFFTSILDTISDGVFISDAMGTTLYVNQMYADLVGVPARDLRGKNVRDLVSEGFFDLALNPEVVRTGKPATYMQKLKDGKNVVISGSPVFDDKGRVCLVVTFVRDETRLAELNEQTGEQRKLIKEINDKLAFVAQSQGRDLEPVFSSSAMQSVAMELKRYASTDATVLIMGETGVGKDVFARLTHRWSRRKDKILLKVDCGGISETLTESEIFGYVPGAFTGASSKGKPGYFEIADGSTIFLDEVGELPLSMQTRLLRVLQDNEIVRVGSSQPRKVDVRIIAATNRPWALDSAMLRGGRFDTQIYVGVPDLAAREFLVNRALGGIAKEEDVDLSKLAWALEGYGGGDVTAICEKIKLEPYKREVLTGEAQRITREDCNKVLSSSRNVITPEELEKFKAYREGNYGL